MPKFYLHISDGKEAEVDIDVRDAHKALNPGVNAPSQFACKAFPPPENISIAITDAHRKPVAELNFAIKISYAPGVQL